MFSSMTATFIKKAFKNLMDPFPGLLIDAVMKYKYVFFSSVSISHLGCDQIS